MLWVLFLLLAFTSYSYAHNRIVGGSIVSISNFPYQLSLRRSGRYICGASLLSRNVAVTAAHCIPTNGAYSIKAGVDNLNNSGIVVHIERALVHPSYDKSFSDYDIALLFLAKSLNFSENVQPVKLPGYGPKNVVKEGMIGKVSGWGITSSNSLKLYTDQLRAVELPVWGWKECAATYPDIITERMFCVGLHEGGKDSCSGDSGGPFVVEGVLYGIVSGGMDCAQPGYPGIYTNVQALRRFIEIYAFL